MEMEWSRGALETENTQVVYAVDHRWSVMLPTAIQSISPLHWFLSPVVAMVHCVQGAFLPSW
jgi:hypothetical protein